jgi:hypothetical protein
VAFNWVDHWNAERELADVIRAAGKYRVLSKGRRLHVICPYHDVFKWRARELGGVYRERSGMWTFKIQSKRLVMDLLIEIFGKDAMIQEGK